MYAVSAKWAPALGYSHRVTSRIESTIGSSTTTFKVLGGMVTASLTDNIRRTITATIIDENNRPFDNMSDLLDPYLATFVAYRGIHYDDGTFEEVPVGTFVLDDNGLQSTESSTGSVTWAIKGLDIAARCQGGLPSPVAISSGTPITQATPQLLRLVYPAVQMRLSATPFVTPTLLIAEDSNAWDEARKLHISAAQDLAADRMGVITSTSRVTAPTPPVWSFTEGADADFWEPQRARGAAPNVVTVIGTNSAAPNVRGSAWDANPSSPTYRGGPYGTRTKVVRSENAITNTQAQAMANAYLIQLLGPQDTLSFTAVPNAALDVGDTVMMTRARMGVSGAAYVIAGIDLPLTADTGMTIRCQRSVLTDDTITIKAP